MRWSPWGFVPIDPYQVFAGDIGMVSWIDLTVATFAVLEEDGSRRATESKDRPWLTVKVISNGNRSQLTLNKLGPGEETMAIEEGKAAPAFTLEDRDGEKVSLKDFRGKNVIVYFYPKDNTSGCTKEAIGFRDLWKDFEKTDAVVIGISPDSIASHEKFAAKHDLPFILLSDPEKKVMSRYDAFGEKTMYGKKVQGVIRSTVWVGPDGKVKKHWRRVPKAADHPAKVLEALSGQV